MEQDKTTLTNNRLVALDVFRGMTIALMFIVNNPGTWSFIYPPLEHAKWHGWTPTDFVFPFFLFAVGVSARFSFKKWEGKAPRALYWKIIKRGSLIFLIGLGLALYLNTLSSFHNLRIMGVLQRIGIAYMIAALVVISFRPLVTALIGVAILGIYWFLVYVNSDPQYPFGAYFNDAFWGIEANLVTKIDVFLLGKTHLYKGFGGIPFDPEGLFSTLPAVASVIAGYFCGALIDTTTERPKLVQKMGIGGIIALVIGSLLGHQALLGAWAFPINKALWSPSYVVFMAGWCLVINAVLIYIIDVLRWQKWAQPFVVMGMNALLAFILAGAYVKTINRIKFDSAYETVRLAWDNNRTVPKPIGGYQKLYETVFSPMTTPPALFQDFKDKKITAKTTPSVYADFAAKQRLSSLFFAIFHAVLFWFVLWILYKRRIFFKV